MEHEDLELTPEQAAIITPYAIALNASQREYDAALTGLAAGLGVAGRAIGTTVRQDGVTVLRLRPEEKQA